MTLPMKGLGPAFLYAVFGTYMGAVTVGYATDSLPACEVSQPAATPSATPLVEAKATQDGCSTTETVLLGSYTFVFLGASGIAFRNRKYKYKEAGKPSVTGKGPLPKNA